MENDALDMVQYDDESIEFWSCRFHAPVVVFGNTAVDGNKVVLRFENDWQCPDSFTQSRL